uniref:Uncharacterized protein n=1 Tax=Leersia perrieri TaxID=77586 RepID=A0A0D9VVN8_9ORYZ
MVTTTIMVMTIRISANYVRRKTKEMKDEWSAEKKSQTCISKERQQQLMLLCSPSDRTMVDKLMHHQKYPFDEPHEETLQVTSEVQSPTKKNEAAGMDTRLKDFINDDLTSSQAQLNV